MDASAANEDDRSIGELFGQLGDEARAYARAEAGLFRAIARRRLARARNGAIALVVAVLLANAALVVLLVGLASELALHTGPAIGALIVAAVVLVAAFLLLRYGAPKLGAIGGDEEERTALRTGETLP